MRGNLASSRFISHYKNYNTWEIPPFLRLGSYYNLAGGLQVYTYTKCSDVHKNVFVLSISLSPSPSLPLPLPPSLPPSPLTLTCTHTALQGHASTALDETEQLALQFSSFAGYPGNREAVSPPILTCYALQMAAPLCLRVNSIATYKEASQVVSLSVTTII